MCEFQTARLQHECKTNWRRFHLLLRVFRVMTSIRLFHESGLIVFENATNFQSNSSTLIEAPRKTYYECINCFLGDEKRRLRNLLLIFGNKKNHWAPNQDDRMDDPSNQRSDCSKSRWLVFKLMTNKWLHTIQN